MSIASLDRASVIAFVEEFEQASASKDFGQVQHMIHPEALFRFNDGDFQGIEAIKTAFENTWAHDIQNEQYQLSNIDVLHLDQLSATVTFNYRWSGITTRGPMEISGRGTQVIVQSGDQLQIKLEHLSR